MSEPEQPLELAAPPQPEVSTDAEVMNQEADATETPATASQPASIHTSASASPVADSLSQPTPPPTPSSAPPVPEASPVAAHHTPEVIAHLQEKFGLLSKTLEREVFRKGMINATVDDMYLRFEGQYQDLLNKVVSELSADVVLEELGNILHRSLLSTYNDSTPAIVVALQTAVLNLEGQFCAVINRQYLDAAVAMAVRTIERPQGQHRSHLRNSQTDSPPDGMSHASDIRGDICLDYENNRCTRGANCRYRHEGGPMEEAASPNRAGSHSMSIARGPLNQQAPPAETSSVFGARPMVVLPQAQAHHHHQIQLPSQAPPQSSVHHHHHLQSPLQVQHHLHHHHHHAQSTLQAPQSQQHHHHHLQQPSGSPISASHNSPASFSPSQVVVGRVPAGSSMASVKVLTQGATGTPPSTFPSAQRSSPPPSGFGGIPQPSQYHSGSHPMTPPPPGSGPLHHVHHHAHHSLGIHQHQHHHHLSAGLPQHQQHQYQQQQQQQQQQQVFPSAPQSSMGHVLPHQHHQHLHQHHQHQHQHHQHQQHHQQHQHQQHLQHHQQLHNQHHHQHQHMSSLQQQPQHNNNGGFPQQHGGSHAFHNDNSTHTAPSHAPPMHHHHHVLHHHHSSHLSNQGNNHVLQPNPQVQQQQRLAGPLQPVPQHHQHHLQHHHHQHQHQHHAQHQHHHHHQHQHQHQHHHHQLHQPHHTVPHHLSHHHQQHHQLHMQSAPVLHTPNTAHSPSGSPHIPLPRSTAASHAPISIDAHDEDMPLNRAPSTPQQPGSSPLAAHHVHHHVHHHHHALHHHHHVHHHHHHHHHQHQQASPQRPAEDMSVFLSNANLTILVDPLSKISITMEELRSLSRGHLELRIKKYVCSKSMREQLWESLHPDGNYPTTPRKDEPAAAASPGHLDPISQLKHFAANNAIASFGTRSKQTEATSPQQDLKNSATTQTVKTMLNLPQPRSGVPTVSSPASAKKPPTSAEDAALYDGKEVRALLWISGTQRSNLKVIRETVSYYGSVLDCGYLPRSKDAVYVKFSAYNKELQQTKHIPTGPGRHSESFTVVDLTLYNHGHIDDGSVPAIPESLISEARSSSDRHATRALRGAGGSLTGSPHHNIPQPNSSFGRRSVGEDSNAEKSNSFAGGRRGTTDSYDHNDDDDEEMDDDRPRRGGKRDSNMGSRRGGASGSRRGGRGSGSQDDDSWDHYASNTVCKYYRSGACKRGDTCKFAHPPQ